MIKTNYAIIKKVGNKKSIIYDNASKAKVEKVLAVCDAIRLSRNLKIKYYIELIER